MRTILQYNSEVWGESHQELLSFRFVRLYVRVGGLGLERSLTPNVLFMLSPMSNSLFPWGLY